MEEGSARRALLENSRLFRGFSPAVLDAVEPLLMPCRFGAGALVCLKGDESDCLYLVGDGELEVSVSSSDGKVILLGALGPGDVVGEVGLLDGEARTANVSARTDALLYRLSSADFATLMKSFGVAELTALTSYICLLFRRVTNALEETVFLDAGVRIARKILELHDKSAPEDRDGDGFKIAISQENLGRMAGLSREATNKALSRLESAGLIRHQYRRIIVPDIKRFTAMVEDETL